MYVHTSRDNLFHQILPEKYEQTRGRVPLQHVPATFVLCVHVLILSLQHVPATCPCNMSLLHFFMCVHVLILSMHATCPCCTSLQHVPAICPCCMSLRHVLATLFLCTRSDFVPGTCLRHVPVTLFLCVHVLILSLRNVPGNVFLSVTAPALTVLIINGKNWLLSSPN